MSDNIRPTKKQRALLDFIEQFISENGFSPSYREIMNGCNYNSIATVAVHINNLINRGHLRKRDHSARSLELTQAAKSEQTDAGADEHQPHVEAWLESKVAAMLERIDEEPALHADLQTVAAALRVLSLEPVAVRLEERLPAAQPGQAAKFN